jgi:hypothetical protein
VLDVGIIGSLGTLAIARFKFAVRALSVCAVYTSRSRED